MSDKRDNDEHNDNDHGRDHDDRKIQLSVIVNGTVTVVETQSKTHLITVITKALTQTGNHGQPPENWELRDEAGAVLDPQRTTDSYHLVSGTKLFLNLKAGVGGERAVLVEQTADPAVSRVKFDREVAEFKALEADYRRRGWLMFSADFSRILVALAAPQLKPIAIVTGVLFDYTNYDARPPSVHLVDPFTEQPYTTKNCPTMLPRIKPQTAPAPAIPGLPEGVVPRFQFTEQLMQSYGQNDVPFLCLPGVREYHDHPAHSGDAWELHRAAGAGRLVRLLEVIFRIGIEPITSYNVNLVPQISFAAPPAQ